MNVVAAIRSLEKQIKEKEQSFTTEINKHKQSITTLENQAKKEVSPLKLALGELRKLNTVCENCEGKGTERYTDAAGDTDARECRFCKGSGISIFGGYIGEYRDDSI